jgi:Domain of unknown function (DUF4258)
MAEPTPFRRPIRWDHLRADEAEREIKRRAEDSANVVITTHAFDRVEQRSIVAADVYRILRTGHTDGIPQKAGEGEWKVVMVKRMPGTRLAGVVTAIASDDDQVVVVTVEWMDWLR